MWTIQFLILIGVTTQHVDAEGSDSVYPGNLAVIVGQPIQFLCGTTSDNESIIWKVKKIGKLNEELISNGYYVTKIYRALNFMIVQLRTGYSLLKKDFAQLDDAGTYKCIRTSRDESVIGIGTAQLVVFGHKPECYSNAAVMQEGDCLHIFCSIHCIGSLNPVIECSGIDGIDSKNLTKFSGSGNLTVFNECVSSSDNGRNISCRTHFEPLSSIDNRSDSQKADNAPEFNHLWNHQLNVEFRPKSVAIDPRKDVYMNGDVIRCIADGNPIPLYTWKETGSNDGASLDSTLIVNEKTMQGHTYECTATNAKGSLSTSVTIRVSESNSVHDFNMIRAVTTVAGVLCAVLFVVVIAITIKRIAESCKSSAGREFATGPDIVQYAEEFESVQDDQAFNGYAQAEDIDIGRPMMRYAGSVVDPESRREVHMPNCAMGVMQNGNPIYDEINSEVKAAATLEEKSEVEFPVYGKVSKPSKGAIIDAANIPSEEFPAYGKVQKKANEKMQDDFVDYCHTLSPSSNPDETEESRTPELFDNSASLRRVIVGADGTEYLDMSAVKCLMQPEDEEETRSQSPTFTRSQYAQIDHTRAPLK